MVKGLTLVEVEEVIVVGVVEVALVKVLTELAIGVLVS